MKSKMLWAIIIINFVEAGHLYSMNTNPIQQRPTLFSCDPCQWLEAGMSYASDYLPNDRAVSDMINWLYVGSVTTGINLVANDAYEVMPSLLLTTVSAEFLEQVLSYRQFRATHRRSQEQPVRWWPQLSRLGFAAGWPLIVDAYLHYNHEHQD
jgi:hypothetical protein